MAYTPPTYTPSGSLFGNATPSTPYTYGNLGNTTSSYNLWGSKGNPYLVAGPTYTPGSGAPINPQPLTPIAPPSNGGGGGDSSPIPDWVDPNSAESQAQSYGDLQSWLDRDRNMTRGVGTLFGAPLFDPAVDLMYGINPLTQQSYSWYDGSTDDFGYVDSDSDLTSRQYSASLAAYQADKAAGMTDETWGERWAADKAQLDTANKTAQPVNSWWDNIWGDTPAAPTVNTPKTFGNTNSVEAVQSRANIANEKARVANNIASIAAEEARAARVTPSNPYGFAPNDVVTGDTGTWTNPAADVDTSTLSGSTGTTNASYTSNGDGTGTFTSDEMGSTGVTDYGGGYYGVDVGDGEEVGYEDPNGGDSGGDSGGGGGSYIATAATQSLGEEGLQVFNNWRDYMSTWHPTFKTSYGRYRVTAPKIVKAIDAEDNSKELYKEIWDKHLKPIFDLIKEDKDNPKALSDYKVMVKELMNKYLKGKE